MIVSYESLCGGCVSVTPLAPLQGASTLCADKCKNQEGNNPMYDKVYYLEERISGIYIDKVMAAAKQFGVEDDREPRTPKDLVERIQAGKYILPDETKRKFYGPMDGIIWRDPAVKADYAGYDAALAEIGKQRQIARDIVKTTDDIGGEGLKALQAFEAWQPTATTTAQ